MTRATAATADRVAGRLTSGIDGVASVIGDLIRIDTTSPHDDDAFPYLIDYVRDAGFEAHLQPIAPSVTGHPMYTPHPLSTAVQGRHTLRARVPNPGATRRVLLQSHVDVVPVAAEWRGGFEPAVVDGILHGRGSCDAKGNIVMAVEAMRAMRDLGIASDAEVYLDVVVEEEIGGNGALGSIVAGLDVDEVIVFEPTSLEVFTGHRGCISFAVTTRGSSSHMGNRAGSVSAIDKAMVVVDRLRSLETIMVERARTNSDFSRWPAPIQLNVGAIHGGEWAGSVAAECTILCSLGFVPPGTADSTRDLVLAHINDTPDAWVRDHTEIKWDGLRNGAYMGDPTADLPRRLAAATGHHTGSAAPQRGWSVSCDARLYHDLLNVPTVVFGCGALADAHSSHERLELRELAVGAGALAEYLAAPGQ